MTHPEPRRLIVGITGASGAIYGIRILQALQGSGVETHLVMSDSARITLAAETDMSAADARTLQRLQDADAINGARRASDADDETAGFRVSHGAILHAVRPAAWGE